MSWYVEVIKYGVFIAIIIIGSWQVYKKMRQKTGGKQKWEDFLED